MPFPRFLNAVYYWTVTKYAPTDEAKEELDVKLSEPFPYRMKRKPTMQQTGDELASFEAVMGMVDA